MNLLNTPSKWGSKCMRCVSPECFFLVFSISVAAHHCNLNIRKACGKQHSLKPQRLVSVNFWTSKENNSDIGVFLYFPVILISLHYLLLSQTLRWVHISVTSWWAAAWANTGENSWVTSLSPMRIDLKPAWCSVTETGLSSSCGDSESPGQIVFVILGFF